MPTHRRCFHCYKGFNSSQAIRAHISNKRKCQEAYQGLLRKYRPPNYDPTDPEAHPTVYDPPMGWEEEKASFDDFIQQPDQFTESSEVPVSDSVEIPSPLNDMDNPLYIEPYPGTAGTIHGKGVIPFIEAYHKCLLDHLPFHPFSDKEEWEFAEKLMTSGMSLTQINHLIKLPIVSYTL